MPDESHAFDREKRVLITRADEEALDDFLREFSRSCGIHVTLSDVLRAAIHILTTSRDAIINRTNGSEILRRPAFSDHEAMARFRAALCTILFGVNVNPPPPRTAEEPPEGAADAGA